MSARKVAVWTGAFGALALVLFVVGTVLDLRVAEAFYLRNNAFADMYDCLRSREGSAADILRASSAANGSRRCSIF